MWGTSVTKRNDILEQNVDVSDNEEGDVIQNSKQEVITLKYHLGSMRKRRHEVVLRVKGFKLSSESEKYFNPKLILYLWHSKSEVLGTFDTYADHYHNVNNLVEYNTH